MNKEFKVVLIGDKESGKTKWIENLFGKFDPTYVPTLGFNTFEHSVAGLDINFWDTAGDSNYAGLGDGYLIGSDACVVFGDNKQKWIDDFQKLCPEKPIILFDGDETLDNLVNALI